ncbi:YajQ family cyclic di-GMP-binding protein [Helicobacter monodelphidis]|uniref:YajQ family cyclic di-GMP-binding protein n=1 Tax=Helicobacter sp. 15-1451 TaxID=2004995 RepID=UPI000DCDEC50|nr:YajQ family cyclic di-GMP-binding protein [Helicobacter sp. 15-1451]RAX56845.1 YajQ family cyclic di-GMP-binding protein [Helicobacter sp. 15-1451]
MATKEHTFDLSAKVDIQELKNAIEQTKKEIDNRYDFKNDSVKEIQFDEKHKAITITATSDNKLNAIQDVLHSKLTKRSLSLKTLTESKRESASGGNMRLVLNVNDTLKDDDIRKINQLIKKQNFKVVSNIMGNEIRFKSKSIDELQSVIAFLKGAEIESPLSFSNFK